MDTIRECCICHEATLVSLTELVQNEEIVRQLNDEYDKPSNYDLKASDIGVLCDGCRGAVSNLKEDIRRESDEQ